MWKNLCDSFYMEICRKMCNKLYTFLSLSDNVVGIVHAVCESSDGGICIILGAMFLQSFWMDIRAWFTEGGSPLFLPAYRDIAAVMQRAGMQESRERGESQENADCNGNIAFDMVLIASAISRAGVYLGIR